MKTLDCRHQKCPHPVLETRKLLLSEGHNALQVLVGDETAGENVARLATSQGYEVSVAEVDSGFALTLMRGEKPSNQKAQVPAAGKTIVYVASDTMGIGDDELGRVLLKNFLFTLNELDVPPDQIIFVNSGVKLVCRGSDALEGLEQLACQGVEIAACGLCLEFFHLKDKLAVGRIGNMLETATALTQAGRVVRP
jgi:selenium metabolism protein YedF